MKYLDTQIHKHHIVPRYAGGTNDPSNLVELTIVEHANIHWWMYLNERRNVFNLLESKGVKITKEMIQHIPWQNRNDNGAAGVIARGQIDGIDMSGENNPSWIDGRWANDPKAWERKRDRKEYWQTPKFKARKNTNRRIRRARNREIQYFILNGLLL
tara:strand:+ start:33 stop:503 length:471 start_codon:yes stop_codon:yes gene_type:complete